MRLRRWAWAGLACCGIAWAQPRPSATGDDLVGRWLAPAEDADDVDAVIEVARDGASWRARIQAIPSMRPDQKWHDDSVCQGCPPPASGLPFKGLTILWDVQATGEHAWQGRLLDPSDGRVYRCQIRAGEGGTLRVHAYLGLPALGHTMIWRRWP